MLRYIHMTVGAEIKKQNKFAKILSGFWDEVLYGGYLIALNNALILLIAIVISGSFAVVYSLLLISFLIVVITYKFNHLKELETDLLSNPERSAFVKKHKYRELVLICIFTFILLINSYLINIPMLIIASMLLAVGIYYPKHLTRKIIGFKDYYVSLSWSFIIFLPYLVNTNSNSIYIFAFLYVFVFIKSFINIVFSDFKDVDEDRRDGLMTFPVVMGNKKTVKLLKLLNILSILPILLGIAIGVLPVYVILLIFTLIYTNIYLNIDPNEKENLRKKSYTLVDSEAVVWLLTIIIGRLLL